MQETNGVILQCFHWYTPADGRLWEEVASRATQWAEAGFSAVWLPPAYKGTGGAADVGYGVYDLYDLGEFDQCGSIRTKYGTRDQYLAAIQTLQSARLQVYADTVLNHRVGADGTELVRATPFPQNDRLHAKGPQREIRAYTRFDFPGRQGKYSTFNWSARHFDAVDYDASVPAEKDTVYLLDGKQFDGHVALENGNFSYLMGADLDFQDAEVRAEVTAWGKWYLDTTGVDGFRLDAVKHISAWFFPQWLDEMERHAQRDLFTVAEYWSSDLTALDWYLEQLGGRIALFGVPLHFHFHRASQTGGQYDMRRLLDGTLMRQRERDVVTFVENHDSQPLQALESVVEPWFKPLAYAFILLRREGYPCVFAADYYGAEYEDYGRDSQRYHIVMPSHRLLIDKFLYARRHFAYGPQIDYFDHFNRIGWTRLGTDEHPRALAVLMSDGPPGTKWMNVRARTRSSQISRVTWRGPL